MSLKTVEERLAQIQKAFAALTTLEDDEIVDIPSGFCPLWTEYLTNEKPLDEGVVVQYDKQKYRVMQYVGMPLASQPPDGEGLLALYRPYRDKGIYEWLYGEYCTVGDLRFDGEDLYVAIQDPNTNIYAPSVVPAIWELVVDELEELEETED